MRPVFFRVDPQMRCDFQDARRRATPGIAALYVIHYAGFAQDMEEARRLADELGVPLIEDCALALLSRQGDKPLGSYGDVSVFCLYKTLPVPNGGALLARGRFRDELHRLPEVDAPGWASTASHLTGSLLSNLELRAGPIGRTVRELSLDPSARFANVFLYSRDVAKGAGGGSRRLVRRFTGFYPLARLDG